MSKDKNRQDGSSPADAKDAADTASAEAKRSKDRKADLEEGLDESFPGSDAPASTRRSTKD